MKYPKPIKKSGKFYCQCGYHKGYKDLSGYRYHYRKAHGHPDRTKEKSPIQIKVERIQESQRPREEKLTEMYDAVREFNKSLQSISDSRSSVDFKVTSDYLLLIFISDLHYGNVNVDMDYIDKLLNFVQATDRVYAVLNGDILDNWVMLSPQGGIYEQSISPEHQKDIIVNRLMPLKDKILGLVYGNHEGRSQKSGEKNPAKVMAEELDLAYLGAGGRINLNFGKLCYKIHVRHKFRYESSFNPTHACNRLVEQLDAEADIVAIGHKHEPATGAYYKAGKQRTFLRFGSAMPTNSYADYLGFGKTPMVAPCVVINGKTKQHEPFLDIDIASQFLKRI